MKKLVAISVLFVSLAAAVFAQDEGKWKVGLMARYVTDMLYATGASGKSEASGGGSTQTQEFGKYNKGSFDFFGNHDKLPHPDNRLLLSLSNSGENYDVYADISMDNWANSWNGVWDFLQHNAAGDWHASGTAGIFNAQVGTSGYGGWVSTQATWNDWLGWNHLCRFGVWRGNDWDNDFYVGNEFRTWNQWGTVLAMGVGLGDNYKVSLGYRLNPGWSAWNGGATDPWASKSAINASFLVSGKPADAITFDLFYTVKGQDGDNFSRPIPTSPGNKSPDASWSNIIGAYIGINGIQNLGLSLGYTANFNAYEAGSYWDSADTDVNPVRTKAVTYTAPFYSGIDLHVKFSGIDKIGLTFSNNFSLAGAKGKKPDTGYNKEFIYGLDESVPLGEGDSEDWFHWNTELTATFALVENLGLTLSLGDQLGVTTYATDANGSKSTVKNTSNEFRISAMADYGIGSVNIGTGLFFSVNTTAVDAEYSGSGFSATYKGSANVTKFGIPVFFKVAF